MNDTTLSFGGGADSSFIGAMDLNRPLAAKLLGIELETLNAALPEFNEVVFADTGAESKSTYANVQRFKEAFEAAGKTFHIVRRHEVINQRVDDESITDWLLRLGTVPVMGGGSHVCSNKFKGEVIRRAIGDREYIIGIEANEGRRLVFTPPKGGSTYRHPLVDLGVTREQLLELLPKLGFEGVEKSSCVFCPFKSEDELRDMYLNDREAWALCEQVEESFRQASPIRHQDYLDAGCPSPTPNGMWRLDSWAEGRRLFTKTVNGQQLTVGEWAEKFESERSVQLIAVVDVTDTEDVLEKSATEQGTSLNPATMATTMRQRTLIIACSENKADDRTRAIDLYQSRQHRLASAAQDNDPSGDDVMVWVLSAGHGLVTYQHHLDPYEQKLTPARADELAECDFQQFLFARLVADDADEVFVYGGKLYRDLVGRWASQWDFPITHLVGENRGCGDHYSALKGEFG